jgi:hypothetical protein
MIDIQPHLDKLELLREYMGLFIDDKVRKAITPPKTTMQLFEETGMLMMPNYSILPSFEVWLQIKSIKTTNWKSWEYDYIDK